MPKKLSESTANRLVALVIGQDVKVSDALRRMADGSDGGQPQTVSRAASDRILRDARSRIGEAPSVQTVAGRVLTLLSLELERIETQSGPRDLDRLHRIGQTLATVDRLAPKTQKTDETPSLLSLQDEAS